MGQIEDTVADIISAHGEAVPWYKLPKADRLAVFFALLDEKPREMEGLAERISRDKAFLAAVVKYIREGEADDLLTVVTDSTLLYSPIREYYEKHARKILEAEHERER